MIKFAFERICFMKFGSDECEFFLASSNPYHISGTCTMHWEIHYIHAQPGYMLGYARQWQEAWPLFAVAKIGGQT